MTKSHFMSPDVAHTCCENPGCWETIADHISDCLGIYSKNFRWFGMILDDHRSRHENKYEFYFSGKIGDDH